MDDSRVFIFKNDQFDDMLVNVVKETRPVLELLPVLKSFPEFQEGNMQFVDSLSVSLDQLLRYIILFYDPNTPLTKRIPDVPTRKFNALYYAGIHAHVVDGFTQDVLELVQCRLGFVNALIYRYAQFCWNDDYATLLILQESYERVLKAGFSDQKEFEKSKGLRKEIENLTKRLFKEDSKELQMDFFDYLIEERLNIRPEDIALTMKAGKDPLPAHVNPYKLSNRKQAWISTLQH